MLYRAMDQNDDYTGFSGNSVWYNNSPQAVAQKVKTTLRLILGEWFLDNTVGVNYPGGVLGKFTGGTRDAVIRQAILGVPGVKSIQEYKSNLDGPTRVFTVTVQILTIYSQQPVTVQVTL